MAENPTSKLFPIKSRLQPNSKKPSSSPESKYWKSFKSDQISGLISSIASLDFSPSNPNDLALTSSASISIYDSKSFTLKSTISSFSDLAYSATFRSDGRLLAAGGESGLVQVFDPKTRLPLRHLRGHSRPVRIVKYPAGNDKLHLFSGGDDALLKYWDVAGETQILSFQAHKDYIRSGSPSPVTDELFATGSYDHNVKVWDVRVSNSKSDSCVMEFNHGKPVEDVLFLPSGGLIATAGGNSVKIWDVIGGGRLLHTMDSHNKTVTSLCIGKVEKSGEKRILSVSLDGYMKVFDYAGFRITHSMRFPAPLMSVGFSPLCSSYVIGTSNGNLFIGKRKERAEVDDGLEKLEGDSVVRMEKRVLKLSNYRYFHRGQTEKPSEGDSVIKKRRMVKIAEHDKLLRKFRHKEALVSVLNQKDPRSTVAVMEELIARKKLLKCVSNLDVDELLLLLNFLCRFSTMPRYASFLMGLARKVLQLRTKDIRDSDAFKNPIRNLRQMIDEEIKIQHSLQEIQGIISPLLRIAGR
ncbi:transducin family protein / WD-40 repeat family protein [Tasmannia lanceolata]|uniref:transducin family protein / WD-40 repeat family protein n=1 Tax=Tasmannia lanceolata TaxID=3420 RepID=UPI0040643AC2